MSTAPAGRGDGLPRFGRKPALAAFLAFLVVGALFTWPLARHLGTALPFAAVPPDGRETAGQIQGDYLQFYYYLWLVRDRVLAGASFLRDPYQFAVDGPRVNLPNTFLPFALLYLPLSLPDPRLGYNLLVLLSFPLAGLSATLLAHRYGVARGAALVAGLVFACGPYRVGALLGGHPSGLAYFLVPLTLWGLEGALAGSAAGGVWAAAALASMAVVEPHFFYFASLGLPLYLLARVGLAGWTRAALWPGPRGAAMALALAVFPAWGVLAALRRQGWQPPGSVRLAIAAAVALGALGAWQCAGGLVQAWRARGPGRIPLGPLAFVAAGAGVGAGFLLLLRSLLLTRSVSGTGRTLHEVLLFSPLPADLLARVNPSAGRTIYPGVIALGLALVGTGALARRPPEPRRRILLAFGPILALAMVLSLGPRLAVLPLFEVAFHLVPTWNFIRQPAKFQVLVGLALSVLAAVGVEAITRHRRAATRAVLVVALALLVAVEYHPWRPTGLAFPPTSGRGLDVIRALGPRALYLPLWPGDSAFSALYLYATTLTRVPMLNGYSVWVDRSYVTDVYRPLEAINLGVLGDAEAATLARYRVRQVVLDRDAFPLKVSPFGPAFTRAGLRASPFLEPVETPGQEGPLWVFRVRDHPLARAGPPPRSSLGVYWEAESLARETGRITDDPGASNGRTVLARAGRDVAGFVVFGPFRLLPAGPFRAVFRLRGEGTTVELQVTAAGGRRVLGARTAHFGDGRAFEEIPVPFALDAAAPVEYRVRWDGTGWVAVDAVAIAFADVPDPALGFEVEDLAHELAERRDPEAQGGWAGYADPRETPRDQVLRGPLRRYPAGSYRLWVRLKLDRPTPGPFAWCGAQAASAGPMRGGRELSGAEVPEAGRYVELAVPFALPEATVIEFPCLYRGGVGVWFDALRVEGPRRAP